MEPRPASGQPAPCMAIGIDVGGTKIAAGLVDLPEGRVHATRRLPTPSGQGGEAVLDVVLQLASDLLETSRTVGRPAGVIGLGVCELVTPEGEVASANAVAWRGIRVRARLSNILPTFVDADVRAAARAEAVFGAGRTLKSFLYVTLGTGISCCLVIEGRPYTGVRGAAGTMASSPWTRDCEHCGQIENRTLEDLAAGPALVERLIRREPAGAERMRRAEDVLTAAARGEAVAVDVVTSAASALGVAVGWLVNVLDPEAVIVGGGLGLAGGLYRDVLVDSTRRHIWSELNRELPIEPAQTGEHAGWLGAAVGAWQSVRV